MTFYDYARYRLSIFSREEAAAIVGYLEYRRDSDSDGIDTPSITAALDGFWRERAATAPLLLLYKSILRMKPPISGICKARNMVL